MSDTCGFVLTWKGSFITVRGREALILVKRQWCIRSIQKTLLLNTTLLDDAIWSEDVYTAIHTLDECLRRTAQGAALSMRSNKSRGLEKACLPSWKPQWLYFSLPSCFSCLLLCLHNGFLLVWIHSLFFRSYRTLIISLSVSLSLSVHLSGHLQDGVIRDEDARRWIHAGEEDR